MKKLFFTLLANVIFISIFAQAPQEINYQGVARNSTGTLLSNQNIGIKLDLHQGSAGGTIVFSETHNKTTNAFGLFTLGIGSVNVASFTGINWANGPYFLEVSMDPAGGTSYSSVGTQQFMSVPYALYAQTAGNASATPTITINAPNTVTSSAGSYTINVPAAITYSAGAGIDITGGVISNTAAATTPTITGTGATTVTSSGNTFTINTPSPIVYTAGTGIDITGGVISNTAAAVSPTINSGGVANVTNPSSNVYLVDVPAPTLNYNSGTNELTLTQNGATSTATLNGTGSNTVSVVGSGIASVTPTTGSTFTVSVPNPTFTSNGPTSISGTYPSYTVNSVASPSTSLVSGNLNLTLLPSGNTYTLDVKSYSLTANSNTLTLSNGASITSATVPASPTTSLTAGANVTVTGSAPNYTVSAPAYSISLPGGNVAQITNGISTSTAAINATSLTLTGVNNNVLSAGGNTVALNTYTAGTGITISGTAPNYTLASPNQSLSITGNSLSITGANTVTIPTSTVNGLGTGIATVTTSVNNFTVNVPAPTYTAANGVLGFGTNTVDITPTLSLTGTTLTSGAATNSVSLAGLNGIYGGSGAIQTGSTTVTVGTNTLTFLSGTTAGKPIANFYGGGITGTSMNLGHIGANSASLKFIGSATTTPVDYGYVSGSTNGISISGGTSTNGLYATNSAEVGVGTYTTGIGKFIVTHTASQANPTMHLRETTGGLNRIKFSNNTVANKFFETAAQTNAVDANGAYSINYFDGTTYKPVLLVTGEKKVNINNLNTVLGSLHVMENSTTAGNGIISEGFAQAAQINLARNNQPALAARTAVVAGDELGRLNFAGYDGAAFGDGAKIYAKAAENVTGSNKGTELIFAAVPTGTNTNKEVFKINGTNKLEVITGMVIPLGAANGKVLTSDATGNASWQAITAPASAWTSTLGSTYLTNIGDRVGIGTNSPTSKLQVENTLAGDVGLYLYQAPSTTNEALFIDNRGSQQAAIIENNNSSNTNVALLATSNGIGGAIRAQNTSTANTTDVLNVSQVGLGNASYFSVNNSGNFAKAVEAQHNGNGSAIGAANSGSGRAGEFAIQNATNNSSALYATTNGGGTAIYANNTNATNTSAVIQANQISNGVAIYATNTNASSGSAAQFDGNNSSVTLNAINYSSGNAINASAGSANAIYATNNSSTTAAVYASNSGTYDGLMAHSIGGRAIYAQSSSAGGYSALEAIHYGTGTTIMATKPNGASGSVGIFNNNNASNGSDAVIITNSGVASSLYASKPAASTNGNVVRFENLSTGNAADAIMVTNNGSGAAIHAVSGPTVAGSSNSALLLENGHIDIKQSGAGTGISSVDPLTVGYAGATDVAGTIETYNSFSILTGASGSVTVFFGKNYKYAPIVTITATSDLFSKLSYYVVCSASSFTIYYKNSTGANINIPASVTQAFSYHVIGVQ